MEDRLQMKTKDPSQERIRMIGELFPNRVTEATGEDPLFRNTTCT